MQDPNEYINQLGNTLSQEDTSNCRFVNITLGFHETQSGMRMYVVDEDPNINFGDLWEFCYCFVTRLVHFMWTNHSHLDKHLLFDDVKTGLQLGVDQLDSWLSTKKANELEYCDRSKRVSSRLYFVFCEHTESEKLAEDVIIIKAYVFYKNDNATKAGSGIKFIQNVLLVNERNLGNFLISMFAMFWRYLTDSQTRNTVGEYLDKFKQEMLDGYAVRRNVAVEIENKGVLEEENFDKEWEML